MANLILDWDLFGTSGSQIADGSSVNVDGMKLTFGFQAEDEGASNAISNTTQYVAPGETTDANSGLLLTGLGGEGGIDDTSTTTISFASDTAQYDDSVSNVSFRLNDIDRTPDDSCENFKDVVAIRAYDADGNEVEVNFTLGQDLTYMDDAIYPYTEHEPTDAFASALIEIAGPVARIEIDYNNYRDGEQDMFVSDIQFSTIPCSGLDGYVDGTDDDDLIDMEYTGDPQGDRIDNNDEILDGEGPNDDIVRAGGGDDTVFAGAGDDDVFGGAGNDELNGEEGDDLLDGGDGDDTITGGDGSDTVEGGEGADHIDTSGSDPRNDHATFYGVPVDDDPNDDRDLIDAGAGNDTVITGDDADTIFGGDGNDSIDSGLDDDEIQGEGGDDYINAGLGNDLVYGGDGNDTILAGVDAFSDYVGDDPNLPYPGALNPDGTPALSDPNTADGKDTVDGGDGNDLIFTGDDADMIFGGAGDDTIYAGIDDDYVEGGAGNDSIIGGHGSDTINGNDGDDYINAGDSALLWGQSPDDVDPVPQNGQDLVYGGAGNDTILGQDDNDTLVGGDGNDLIDGGIDNDLISGDAGDDTIIGGEGVDTMSGGDDQDTFLGANAGDYIDGGEGGVDYDTLDLRGSAPEGGSISVKFDDDNVENGIVEYFNADLELTGTARFENIENVVPCFTPGTVIATPQGERMVEDLRVGDRIITRDNGIQEISWLGSNTLTGHKLARAPHLRPILIQKGSLGNGLPEHDIMVSPNHRMLVNNEKTALYFEDREVLVAAKHLTGLAGVDEVETLGVTYIHFMFEQHEVVLSNGAWSESFQPGDQALKGLGDAQRSEIFELFPELESYAGIDAYQSARRSLKKHEALLLVK